MRITKVTTKTGDGGKTSLGNGQRVHKNHPIINTLGELDYLNSIIGWAEVESTNEDLLPFLLTIPLQKLAYYSALNKGFDIDKPRNLAKSVTVE